MTQAQLTFSWGGLPVRTSPSQDFELDLLASEATSHLNLYVWLSERAPVGSFGRMSPACCQLTTDGHLAPSSEGWGNSGMGSPTAFLTLNFSEFHSGAVASSLSDILETGDVPQRYFLSPRACAGILRRAEKRGKELPRHLRQALTEQVEPDHQKQR